MAILPFVGIVLVLSCKHRAQFPYKIVAEPIYEKDAISLHFRGWSTLYEKWGSGECF